MREAAASDELVGGKYRLTRIIGRGGMGAVWEGVHASLGTQVAVKFIDTEYADSEELRRRFVNEARAAAHLQSKHVIQVHDQGVMDDGRPFIVMEFLSGEPLDVRLERLKTLSPEETARIVLHICRGLSKAHAAGIVHRDLKPENVFLVWDDEDEEDIAKVVDFGIAKFLDEGLVGSSATRTGSLLGTPYYMSPEQARGLRSVDQRSDLWSVSVIAYRCIVGQLPFEGEAFGDMLVKICTGETPVPSEHGSTPAEFDAFIARGLAKRPEDRFQTAKELTESLSAAWSVSLPSIVAPGDTKARAELPVGGEAGAPSVSLARRRASSGRRWPWALIGVVLVLSLVMTAFWAARDTREAVEPEGMPPHRMTEPAAGELAAPWATAPEPSAHEQTRRPDALGHRGMDGSSPPDSNAPSAEPRAPGEQPEPPGAPAVPEPAVPDPVQAPSRQPDATPAPRRVPQAPSSSPPKKTSSPKPVVEDPLGY